MAGIAKPKAKGAIMPKAVAEENAAPQEMAKKSTLPPAMPAATATGHQPTPVAGIAKPRAKGKRAIRSPELDKPAQPSQEHEPDASASKEAEISKMSKEMRKMQKQEGAGHRAQRNRGKHNPRRSF